jgi:hypothetical protein
MLFSSISVDLVWRVEVSNVCSEVVESRKEKLVMSAGDEDGVVVSSCSSSSLGRNDVNSLPRSSRGLTSLEEVKLHIATKSVSG